MIYTTRLSDPLHDGPAPTRPRDGTPSLPPTFCGPELRGQARIQLAGSARKLSINRGPSRNSQGGCQMRDDEMVHMSSRAGPLIRPLLYMHTDMYNKERRAENAHLALWFVHSPGRGDDIPQGSCCGWQGLVCRTAARAHTSYRSRPWQPFLGMDTAWMNEQLLICVPCKSSVEGLILPLHPPVFTQFPPLSSVEGQPRPGPKLLTRPHNDDVRASRPCCSQRQLRQQEITSTYMTTFLG